ncbi:recombinase family protein [Sphingomonas sp. RB3P16]|uniref:recombinase family protein n=1 Tax=Parasphingomonas frigoris TaxID=3096163 RepID=UPI002FC5B7F3
MNMRCAVYARFSTDKQDVVSIDTQLMMCRREIEREGWTEVACFIDPAESAATLHRPGMQALLAAVAAGEVDVVNADAMDRLSRSQADIATVYERLRVRGILLATRKEGMVTPLHIGMMGTINAEQLSATSEKTRDALVRRHAIGRNPGGVAYGYDKRIAHDANGERLRGLKQIVPHEAVIVARIMDEYTAGRSPIAIIRQLKLEGVLPPRSQRRDKRLAAKPPAWTPNTLTGNAARGTGILNNILYTGYRPYLKQRFRKNPDTGKRHGFLVADDDRAELVEVLDLRIVTDDLWGSVKARQSTLAQGPKQTRLPFHGRQLPRYLLTGKMTCGECGASYAKSGKTRFGCQGSAKKGPTWCGNRLTIRQDELDARVLAGVQNEMLRPEVFAIFLDRYPREIARLQTLAIEAAPARESELAD